MASAHLSRPSPRRLDSSLKALRALIQQADGGVSEELLSTATLQEPFESRFRSRHSWQHSARVLFAFASCSVPPMSE